MKSQPCPRYWKTLGVTGPGSPLARLIPRLMIKNLGRRPPVQVELAQAWIRLNGNAERVRRIPILLFLDGWTGSRAALVPSHIWHWVMGIQHPSLPPPQPPPSWMDQVHLCYLPDLRLLLKQYAARPPSPALTYRAAVHAESSPRTQTSNQNRIHVQH